MTVAAMTWAFKQKVPPIPKMVLLTLADQADDETGRVCYGRTDLEHIAGKASVGKRSLFRYLAALTLNGYLVRESGATKGAPNQYWICLDREVDPAREWRWTDGQEGEDDPEQDPELSDEGGGENLAHPEGGDKDGMGGVPLVAHIESANQSTKESPPPKLSANEGGNGFSKKSQEEDRAVLAKEREAAKPAQYFVLENSEPYRYWEAEMCRRTGRRGWHLVVDRTVNGRIQRGWWFPSLYPPPKPKAPPGDVELSDEDARAFTGENGV